MNPQAACRYPQPWPAPLRPTPPEEGENLIHFSLPSIGEGQAGAWFEGQAGVWFGGGCPGVL